MANGQSTKRDNDIAAMKKGIRGGPYGRLVGNDAESAAKLHQVVQVAVDKKAQRDAAKRRR